MKFAIFAIAVLIYAANAVAIELVCEGDGPRDAQQRPIVVDCTNRKAVVETLGAAWMKLREEAIGGVTENMCWDPYQRALSIHPSISMNGIAQTFFAQCNMALKYVK